MYLIQSRFSCFFNEPFNFVTDKANRDRCSEKILFSLYLLPLIDAHQRVPPLDHFFLLYAFLIYFEVIQCDQKSRQLTAHIAFFHSILLDALV